MKKEVFIGLTYGDPAGIGPEILLETLKKWKFKSKPIIIGLKEIVFTTNKKRLKDKNLKLLSVPSKHTGLHSFLCLKEAASMAKQKKIAALVTGPVSKQLINNAGIKFKGQTEVLAKFCNIKPENVIMLFIAGDLKIALFTRHIPLKDVSSKLTKHQLINFISLLNKELKKWFHIKNPKIALLGLNPHAGETKQLGTEEKRIIIPIINKFKKEGIKIFGPLSPDGTLAKAGQYYLNNKKQEYDVYISMYHDQALPMFKAVAGMEGVNVTLGLPFLRVSVDHGTAFDIAGKNIASNESLVSAVKLVDNL